MPSRRPIDDEDDPRPPRRGTRTRAARKSVLPLLLLGGGAAAFLAVVGIVLFVVLGKSPSDPKTGGGPAAKGGTSGPAKWAAGAAPISRPAPGPAPAAGTELVTNGGFEDGPEPDAAGPGFTVVQAGAPTIPGWTVTRGSVDYIGPYWQHADGKRSIDLNGNEPGTIAQAIRTKPGAKYRVIFSLSGNMCTGEGGDRTVAVSAAGDRATFTFDTTGHTYEDMGWAQKTWEFTATAAETTLEFTSLTDVPAACGPALDSISVVEIGS